MKMPTAQIPIGLSAANLSGGIEARHTYEFIARAGSKYRAYELRPRGGQCKAALDFYMLLDVAGSVASVASILWMAYDKFIAPKRSAGRDDAGIYIAIRRPDGTVIDLWLRGQTEKEFVQQFELIIDEARSNTAFRVEYERVAAEVEQSDDWVRVDKAQDHDA